MRNIFKKKSKPTIEPSKVVKVGNHIPFNEMGIRQTPALYIHNFK